MRIVLLALAMACTAVSAHAAPSGSGSTQRPSMAERQAAFERHKVEYRRRLLRDGQVSADRWLEAQTRPAPARRKPQQPAPRAGEDKKCKKVRWVNRAAPGFGGGPMTMSRVPVCAD